MSDCLQRTYRKITCTPGNNNDQYYRIREESQSGIEVTTNHYESSIYYKILLTLTPLILTAVLRALYFKTQIFTQYTVKPFGQIYYDTIIMYLLLYIPFTFVRYYNNSNIFTFLGILVGLSCFLGFGEIPFMMVSLVSLSSWPEEAYLLVGTLMLAFICMLGIQIRYFIKKGDIFYFILAVLIPVLILLFGYLTFYIDTTQQQYYVYHVHHWMLLYCLSFIFKYSTYLSQFQGGICLGGFMHGIIAFGPDKFLVEK